MQLCQQEKEFGGGVDKVHNESQKDFGFSPPKINKINSKIRLPEGHRDAEEPRITTETGKKHLQLEPLFLKDFDKSSIC